MSAITNNSASSGRAIWHIFRQGEPARASRGSAVIVFRLITEKFRRPVLTVCGHTFVPIVDPFERVAQGV